MKRRGWLQTLAWVLPALAAVVLFIWWWSRRKSRSLQLPQRIVLDISAEDEVQDTAGFEVDQVREEKQRRSPDGESDDLTKIEGIGPKISAALIAYGIATFAELAALDVQTLQEMLQVAGIRIAFPETWPEQAELAAQNEWQELAALQSKLVRGRRI